MSNRYTTRVELHNADDEDYELLHEEMERRGFTRTIVGSDGITYQLPPAEYDYQGDQSADGVLNLARQAALETACLASILVTEAVRRRWRGLDVV